MENYGTIIFWLLIGAIIIIVQIAKAIKAKSEQQQAEQRRERMPEPQEKKAPPTMRDVRDFLDEVRRHAEEATGQQPQAPVPPPPQPMPQRAPQPQPAEYRREDTPQRARPEQHPTFQQHGPQPTVQHPPQQAQQRSPQPAPQPRAMPSQQPQPHVILNQQAAAARAQAPRAQVVAAPRAFLAVAPPMAHEVKAVVDPLSRARLPMRELQRAIALREILGPPRAMAPWRRDRRRS
jgi:hypothetical protein